MNHLTSIVVVSAVTSALTAVLVRSTPAAEALAPEPMRIVPADELVLSGTPPLMLTNAAGRLSWGTAPGARAFTIGAVDAAGPMAALLVSPRNTEELAAFDADLRAKYDALQERFSTLVLKERDAGAEARDSAKFRESVEAFRAESEAAVREAIAARNDLIARQYEATWKDLRSAVDVVAERRGIDVVYRSTGAGDPFRPGSIDFLLAQTRSRLFVRGPEALDLTDEVLKELNVAWPGAEVRIPEPPQPTFLPGQGLRGGRGGGGRGGEGGRGGGGGGGGGGPGN